MAPFTDYAEFQDSEFYGASPAGAQIAVKLVSDRDPTVQLVGMVQWSWDAELETISVHEGGEAGAREIARGAAAYRGNGSMFFTAKRGDTIGVSQDSFLKLGPFTAYAYAGDAWEDTAGVIYYVIEGLHFERASMRHGAQGDTVVDVSWVALNVKMGAEWAAYSATGTT